LTRFQSFDVPDLRASLQQLLLQIPVGKVTTFGRLAEALGDSSSARGVAHWMLGSPEFAGCPVHRVLIRDGSVGDLSWPAAQERAERLQSEGVGLSDGKVDLTRCLWEDFVTDAPLATLRQLQSDLLPRVSLVAPSRMPSRVGGVDLSYVNDHTGVAALAIVDVATGELLETFSIQQPTTFPYLTGYLTFRELPLHLALLNAAHDHGIEIPEVLLVDGSGILHPRNAGVATHLGVVTDLCTIGVTKTFLRGEVDRSEMRAGETRPILVDNKVRGHALQPRATGKPIFVSPGHRASVEFARNIAVKLLFGRRLPAPIWWADRLSRQTAQGKQT